MEAIENKSLFSPVWWAKYFGLYSCQNSVNEASKPMYFGTNDIHLDSPLSGESSALEIYRTKICKQNGLFAINGDFSLQSLLVMIKRLQNKTFDAEKEVIECHGFTRLVLIEFLVNMLGICMPEDFQWNYDFKDKGLPRDDRYWRSLYLSSNNDEFDISNL